MRDALTPPGGPAAQTDARRHAWMAAVVVAACLALVTAFLAVLPLLGFDPGAFNFRRFRPTPLTGFILVLPSVLVLGVIGLAQVFLHRMPLARLGFGSPVWRNLLAGFAFGVAVAGIARVVRVLTAMNVAVVPTGPDAGTVAVLTTLASALVFLLLNSITEETLFRVYPLQKAAGDPAALVVTLAAGSVLFALMHHQTQGFSFDAFATRVCMGLLLGAIYVASGSAWAPIGVHSGLNAVNAALSGNWAAGGFVRVDVSGPPWSAWVNAVAALGGLALVVALRRAGRIQVLFPAPAMPEPARSPENP